LRNERFAHGLACHTKQQQQTHLRNRISMNPKPSEEFLSFIGKNQTRGPGFVIYVKDLQMNVTNIGIFDYWFHQERGEKNYQTGRSFN
jgi:hypothetical protein